MHIQLSSIPPLYSCNSCNIFLSGDYSNPCIKMHNILNQLVHKLSQLGVSKTVCFPHCHYFKLITNEICQWFVFKAFITAWQFDINIFAFFSVPPLSPSPMPRSLSMPYQMPKLKQRSFTIPESQPRPFLPKSKYWNFTEPWHGSQHQGNGPDHRWLLLTKTKVISYADQLFLMWILCE